MKEESLNGLDINLVRTLFPGHVTVEVEGRGSIVVEPPYRTLAEGLCDALVFFGQGEIRGLTIEDVVANTTVVAIDTDKRYIKIRYKFLEGTSEGVSARHSSL